MKIKQLSDRLRSLKKYLDEESYNIVVENLNLPSSDFITKSGGISTSKKLWSTVSSNEKKSLEAKELPTVNELKKGAKESLEESGVTESIRDKYEEEKADLKRLVKDGEIDEETQKIWGKELKKQYDAKVKEMVDLEVNYKFKVDKNIKESMQEWYDFINEFGAMLASEYPEIEELEKWIYGSGSKSYTELYGWMQDAERVINEALRG